MERNEPEDDLRVEPAAQVIFHKMNPDADWLECPSKEMYRECAAAIFATTDPE